MYEGTVNALIKGSESVFKAKGKNNFNMPGWNDYVADLYESSREARSLWLNQGKPNRGPIYELHVNTKRKVKYAINFIKKNEAQLRKESLAKKLFDCNIYVLPLILNILSCRVYSILKVLFKVLVGNTYILPMYILLIQTFSG